MAKIANVALTNTFDTWRIRSNQVFNRLSQFTIDESKLYANTFTANVRFVSLGATKLGSSATTRIIANGLLSTNGNFTVSGNSVIGAAGKKTITNGITIANGNFIVSGNSVIGAATKRTVINGVLTANGNLSINGNTTIGDAAADRLTLNSNTVTMGAAVLNIDTGLLFLQKNSNRVGVNTLQPNTAFHVNGIVLANSGYKYPDGALTTAPLYVYDSSGAQLYP